MIQCSYDTKSFQMAEKVSKCDICGIKFKNSNHKKMQHRNSCGDQVRLWCSCSSTCHRPAKPLQVLPKVWKRSLKVEVLTTITGKQLLKKNTYGSNQAGG